MKIRKREPNMHISHTKATAVRQSSAAFSLVCDLKHCCFYVPLAPHLSCEVYHWKAHTNSVHEQKEKFFFIYRARTPYILGRELGEHEKNCAACQNIESIIILDCTFAVLYFDFCQGSMFI